MIEQEQVNALIESAVLNINKNILTWVEANKTAGRELHRIDLVSIDNLIRNWIFRNLKGLFESATVNRAKSKLNFGVSLDSVRFTISGIWFTQKQEWLPDVSTKMISLLRNALISISYDRLAWEAVQEVNKFAIGDVTEKLHGHIQLPSVIKNGSYGKLHDKSIAQLEEATNKDELKGINDILKTVEKVNFNSYVR